MGMAEAARQQCASVADTLRERFPKLAELMDASREDVLVYMTFPREHWAQIASRTGSSASTERSSAAPMWWASFRMTRPSSDWWARSCSNKTTNGRLRAAT